MACLLVFILPASVVGPTPILLGGAGAGGGHFQRIFQSITSRAKAFIPQASIPCTGAACCAESRCWTAKTSMPMLACKATRGETICVGAKMWPLPKSGTCVCTSGKCGADGTCSTNFTAQNLYEVHHEVIVAPEDFTVSFIIIGTMCISLLAALIPCVSRSWHASVHEIQRQHDSLDDDGAHVE